MALVKINQLSNGLTVATDSIDSFETVSVGLFVNVGSVNENDKQTGVSHFLEHMAFKGTNARSAMEISYAIESVGGFINAYTSKEVTAFHAKVLKEDVKLAVDIITDIVQHSTFDAAEFAKEQGVIIQEIRQLNDDPDDFVFDMFQAKCFDNERLGTQILGSEKDILSFTPADLSSYLNTKYSTDKMIMSASGNVDHDEFLDIVDGFTTDMKKFSVEPVEKQIYKGGFTFKQKDLEQTHLILGFEGLSHTSDEKFNLSILSTILGGGMSSRLFQEIREKRGLVYSVFSFCSNYKDTGTFGIYAACEDDKAKEVIEITTKELEKIRKDITDEELQKAKVQLKASLMMGLESSSTRMERLANQYLHLGRSIPPSEVISQIDSITGDDLRRTADKVLNTRQTLALIGKGKDADKLNANF